MVVLFFTGCATQSVSQLASGQYVAHYSGTVAGMSSASPVEGVMKVAAEKCYDKSVKIVNLSERPRTAFSHPDATLVFECANKSSN